jgi:tRNA modification GTPase
VSVALGRDTIVAIATPPGRGALAIVRLSGERAMDFASPLVRPWPDEPRHASHGRIRDRDGTELDDVVVVWYRAPHSFTGENAVEITCHGGAISPSLVMAALVAAGARPALPGEFTRRAVLNGRLDILQAEAIGDVIDAGTRAAQRVALAQLDGGLSRRIGTLRDYVLELEALAAYDIDFPEEDDGPVSRDRIAAATDRLTSAIDALIATSAIGEAVRVGAVAVICGAPNVGKSSLFNALLGRRRAIVTDVPGTTRDALEAVIESDGWPIRLVDTAGLRDSTDTVERLGIQISRDYVGAADVLLVCGDDDASLETADQVAAELSRAPRLRVRTKSDLVDPARRRPDGALRHVSAETGEGIGELLHDVAARLDSAKGRLSFDAPVVTRERHRVALAAARDEVHAFRDAFGADAVPPVVAAVHLREATRKLEELIGAVDVEDVLDRVFSSFCVGK